MGKFTDARNGDIAYTPTDGFGYRTLQAEWARSGDGALFLQIEGGAPHSGDPRIRIRIDPPDVSKLLKKMKKLQEATRLPHLPVECPHCCGKGRV